MKIQILKKFRKRRQARSVTQKDPNTSFMEKDREVCPVCKQPLQLTEQGLCENCGNIISG